MLATAELWFIYLITSVILGAIAYRMAKDRGKDPVMWFLIAAIFNIVGLTALGLFNRKKPGVITR